jgi:hypothetical protein
LFFRSSKALKASKENTIDSLLAKLRNVSAKVEADITRQVNEYIDSLDETYIPHTSGDTTRFADSVCIYLEDEYQQVVAKRIATIAGEYAAGYSQCLARIEYLLGSAPELEIDEYTKQRIDACLLRKDQIGMVSHIMNCLAGNATNNSTSVTSSSSNGTDSSANATSSSINIASNSSGAANSTNDTKNEQFNEGDETFAKS